MQDTNTQDLLAMVQRQIAADAKGATPEQVDLATNASLPNIVAQQQTEPSRA